MKEKFRPVDESRLTRREASERATLLKGVILARTSISRGAIKVGRRGWEKEKKIPSQASSAIHRVCLHGGAAPSNFFISFSGRSARAWNPLRAASCLCATICFYQRLPGDVNSHLPRTSSSCSPVLRSTPSVSFSRGTAAKHTAVCSAPWGYPLGKKHREKPFVQRAKGKMARVSHVALPMITLFPRDSHLLFRPATTPSRALRVFSLSLRPLLRDSRGSREFRRCQIAAWRVLSRNRAVLLFSCLLIISIRLPSGGKFHKIKILTGFET